MVNHVALRVNNVNSTEINTLNMVINALENSSFHDDIINSEHGISDFIVTVSPATLQKIKDALYVMLEIVKAERIAIET